MNTPKTSPKQFTEFYLRELDSQVRRSSLILGSFEAGEDVVHDAFMKLYERWDEVKDPGPYLNRMILNGCRDKLRRVRLHNRVLAMRSHNPTSVEENEILWDVLQRLPFKQRASVVLRFYEGQTEREIADLLDCKPGSVGPWINRALQAMRKELS